jgi:hypothetical protein
LSVENARLKEELEESKKIHETEVQKVKKFDASQRSLKLGFDLENRKIKRELAERNFFTEILLNGLPEKEIMKCLVGEINFPTESYPFSPKDLDLKSILHQTIDNKPYLKKKFSLKPQRKSITE